MKTMKYCKNDEYLTPPEAVYPVMKRLKARAVVWCPFDTEESAYVKVLSEHGFTVHYGHIRTGQDFFQTEVPDCDYIISNPPYSLKSEVIRRLYETGKPFAMLVNAESIFDSRERFRFFKEKGAELLILYPRVRFIEANGKPVTSAPFQSGYLCRGICQKMIEFDYLAGYGENKAYMGTGKRRAA